MEPESMQHAPTVYRFALARAIFESITSVWRIQDGRSLRAQVAQVLRELGVLRHLTVFSVDGDEKPWTHQVEHQPQSSALPCPERESEGSSSRNHIGARLRDVVIIR